MIRNYKIYRQTVIFIVNILFFIFILSWFKNNVGFKYLQRDFFLITPFSIFMTCMLSILLLIVYSFRLQLMLKTPLKTSFFIVCFGHGGNSLLPFRLGEVFKIYLAKKIYNISLPQMIVVSFAEKILDISLLLILFFVLLSHDYHLFHFNLKALNHYFLIASSVIFASALIIVSLYRKQFVSVFLSIFYNVKRSLKEISTPLKLFNLLASTFLIWLITFFIFYYFFKLNIASSTFSLFSALILLFLTTLPQSFQITPSNLGLFESMIVIYLITFSGVSKESAVALALVFHLITCIPQVIGMFFGLYLNKNKFSLSRLRERVG